jgi:hypothetical protein
MLLKPKVFCISLFQSLYTWTKTKNSNRTPADIKLKTLSKVHFTMGTKDTKMLLVSWGGVRWDWVHLVCWPLLNLLYQPRMMDDNKCGALRGMIGRGNQSTKTCPSVTLSTTNPTWPDLDYRSEILSAEQHYLITFHTYEWLYYPYTNKKYTL